jgi:hypothetical protein
MLEAVDKVARFFPDLRSDDMQKRRPSGQLAFRNNVQWARQRLVRKGELDKSVRGVWIITDRGRTRLEHEWDNWKPTGLDVTPTTSASLKLAVQRSLKEGLVDDESKLWDLVRDWVDKYWGEEARRDGDEYWVKNTAQKTRSARPGKWSRPDVTAVQVSRFTVLPHRSLEITTFEIKRFEDAKEVTSVYEAAAHQRWAHLSYLVAEVPNLDSV